MAGPARRLAGALEALRALQEGGARVFRSRELSRSHREIPVRNGFLKFLIKGWLLSVGPDSDAGDTTPWYSAFWEFLARYAQDRFDEEWYLSPEQSLLLRGANTTVPVPTIHAHDTSHRRIKHDYLIMQRMPGTPISDHPGMTRQAAATCLRDLGDALRQVHAIHGQHHGYVGPHEPMPPQSDWTSAFVIMWNN